MMLAEDLHSVDPPKIKDVKILRTVVGGRTVYQACPPPLDGLDPIAGLNSRHSGTATVNMRIVKNPRGCNHWNSI